jgi:hypothetical protein
VIPHAEIVPDHEYYCVHVDRVSTDVLVWMVETFGPAGDRWFHYNNKIYFKEPKDYVWFELRT